MSETEKKATVFKGVALQDFIVGTKKPKRYQKGKSYEFKDEATFKSLVNSKRIKT